jgi:hypothetical protein
MAPVGTLRAPAAITSVGKFRATPSGADACQVTRVGDDIANKTFVDRRHVDPPMLQFGEPQTAGAKVINRDFGATTRPRDVVPRSGPTSLRFVRLARFHETGNRGLYFIEKPNSKLIVGRFLVDILQLLI